MSSCMPFTTGEGGVAGFFQCLAQRDPILIERTLVPGTPVTVDHEADTSLMLIQSGQQAGS